MLYECYITWEEYVKAFKKKRAYPNKYVAIFYLHLYLRNFLEVHGGGNHCWGGQRLLAWSPEINTVSAALHKTPLEAMSFENCKQQSASWRDFFQAMHSCDSVSTNLEGITLKRENTVTASHELSDRIAHVGISKRLWKSFWVTDLIHYISGWLEKLLISDGENLYQKELMNYGGELHCTSGIAVKGLGLHMITSEHFGRPTGNLWILRLENMMTKGDLLLEAGLSSSSTTDFMSHCGN